MAGSQKYCKDLANTKLDLRNAANSLQIEGKGGLLPGGPNPPMGGGGWRDGGRDHIYIYMIIMIMIIIFIIGHL